MEHESTYTPTNGFTRWLDSRLPIIRMANDTLLNFPTPKNLNYWWTFGGILTFCLVTQIITGIVLAMHYTPNADLAFASVQRIDRDVPYGWLIHQIHANGASMFFVAVYIHIFRGLYYGSYKPPREILWILGVVIYLLMMAAAFPWLRSAVGPDELLGARPSSPTFSAPSRWSATAFPNGFGAALASTTRRCSASSRCTT